MGTDNLNPLWGYLVKVDNAGPIIELRGRSVPISLCEGIAFYINRNEKGEITLLAASFPCWVNYTKINRSIKVRTGAKITVKTEKECRVFKFVARNQEIYRNEWYLEDAKMYETYILGEKLGQGAFGQVFTLYEKKYGYRLALKVQDQSTGDPYQTREAEILLQLEHICVIKTHAIRYSSSRMYIILEYMDGGDLSRFVNNEGCHLSEQETKIIFYQIVKAIYYLHSKGICHRDLKPANILLCHPKPYTLIKVSDLGLAKSEIMHSPMYSLCGTVPFIAPEILKGGREIYDKKIDIWSMGVILYLSLSGIFPEFSGDTLQFPGAASTWTNTLVIHLLQEMLCKQPLKRFDITMVDQHQWVKDKITRKKVLILFNRNKTRLQKSAAEKKPTSAQTPHVLKGEIHPESQKFVKRLQPHQDASGIGKQCASKAVGTKQISHHQGQSVLQASQLRRKKRNRNQKNKKKDGDLETVINVYPAYKKKLVSTCESNLENITLKAYVPQTTNTVVVPTRGYVERTPVEKKPSTNVYHNNTTMNNETVSTYISSPNYDECEYDYYDEYKYDYYNNYDNVYNNYSNQNRTRDSEGSSFSKAVVMGLILSGCYIFWKYYSNE